MLMGAMEVNDFEDSPLYADLLAAVGLLHDGYSTVVFDNPNDARVQRLVLKQVRKLVGHLGILDDD
jgi:hypothetical protein